MTYLFTQLPPVIVSQPFVIGSALFEITNGRTNETSKGKTFTFDMTLPGIQPAAETPGSGRSRLSLHVFGVGDLPRYPDGSFVSASGLVVFGMDNPSIALHAQAQDVRILSKDGERSAGEDPNGTIFCSFAGIVRKYAERAVESEKLSVLLEVSLPIGDGEEQFTTYAIFSAVGKEEGSTLQTKLQAGMPATLSGHITQLGFNRNPLAPVVTVRTIQSVPASLLSQQVSGEQEETSRTPKDRKGKAREKSPAPENTKAHAGVPPAGSNPSSGVPKRNVRAVEMPVFGPDGQDMDTD